MLWGSCYLGSLSTNGSIASSEILKLKVLVPNSVEGRGENVKPADMVTFPTNISSKGTKLYLVCKQL